MRTFTESIMDDEAELTAKDSNLNLLINYKVIVDYIIEHIGRKQKIAFDADNLDDDDKELVKALQSLQMLSIDKFYITVEVWKSVLSNNPLEKTIRIELRDLKERNALHSYITILFNNRNNIITIVLEPSQISKLQDKSINSRAIDKILKRIGFAKTKSTENEIYRKSIV